jgi:cytochrome P450
LVDELISKGPPANVHDRFSVPLTSQVMCVLLGVPQDDIPCFREWAGDGVEGAAVPSADGMEKLMSYAEQLLAQRRAMPADDAVSALLAAGTGSGKVHAVRSVKLLAGMLAFGWQTPASMIESGIALLLVHPAQRQLLREQPTLMPRAVDEILRLSRAPLAIEGGIHRQARADVTVGGVAIRKGDMILLDLMEANRDSDVFPDPERFDIRRDPNPHLAFGYAFYMCNFARLARSEIGIGLAALLDGLPGLRLAAQTDMSAPDSIWKESTEKLTVVW